MVPPELCASLSSKDENFVNENLEYCFLDAFQSFVLFEGVRHTHEKDRQIHKYIKGPIWKLQIQQANKNDHKTSLSSLSSS